jgi:hypothetical protein
MPIVQGYEMQDGERRGYYQWNPPDGQRYYYTPGDKSSRTRAKNNAEEQQAAAYASGYDG